MDDFVQVALANVVALFLVTIAAVVMLWATQFAQVLAKNWSGMSRPVYLPYTLYTVFISAWILSNAYFQSDLLVYLGVHTATIMALMANMFSGLAFAFAFLVSCRLASARPNFQLKTWQWALFSLSCGITLITNIVPGLSVKSVDIHGLGNFVIHFGSASGVFFASLLLLLVLTLANFIQSSRSKLKLKRVKASYMIFGMAAFVLSTFLAHFLIPVLFNDFSMAWVPPALSLIEAMLVGYALLHNRFYSNRYIGFIAASTLLNATIYITPIAVVGFSKTPHNTMLLVVWTLTTGICWHKSLTFIRRIANQLLYKKKGNPVENIYNLIGEFRYSTDQAVVKLNQALNAKSGRIQRVGSNTESNVFVAYLKNDSYFHSRSSVLVKEEIEYQLKHEEPENSAALSNVAQEMDSASTSLVLPITNDKNEITHLYLAAKENENTLFSSEEIMGLQRLFDEASRFIHAEDKVRNSQVLAGSIAHEIRNPLTKIKYHFERIDADMFGAENADLNPLASKEMKKIYQELSEGKKAVQLGTRFIDAVLDELRGEGISTTSFDYYSVAELTSQALKDFSFNNEEHELRINIDSQDDFLFHGSDTLYSFILFNLLKNAVYFFESNPDSQVRIFFKKEPNCNSVYVIDTGPGISADHQKHIFDELYTHGKEEGNGLGLSYCKRVMESFGGSITCRSKLGQYTEFKLSFPSIDELVHVEASQTRIKEYLAGMSCLVLGDAKEENWLGSELSSLGLDVKPATNAQLHQLSQQAVDFILMDRNLLKRELGTVKAMRAGDLGHQAQVTPIILYGANKGSDQPNSIEASPLFQGKLYGIKDRFSFQHSLEFLINEGCFAKLGSLIGKQVLIVDDMQVNRLLIQAYLASEGIAVIQASSGDEAVQMAKAESPDLILMDIHMPGINGIEATKQIRQFLGNIPVIALSGENSESTSFAIDNVMDGHLVKPVTKQQLIKTLKKWIVQELVSEKDTTALPHSLTS